MDTNLMATSEAISPGVERMQLRVALHNVMSTKGKALPLTDVVQFSDPDIFVMTETHHTGTGNILNLKLPSRCHRC